MINGFLALMLWSRECSPPLVHAVSRSPTQAVPIARNAAGALAARVVNSRDMVSRIRGHDSNTPGSSRSAAHEPGNPRRARQSPSDRAAFHRGHGPAMVYAKVPTLPTTLRFDPPSPRPAARH